MTVDTRVPHFCVGPQLVAILLNTYGEDIFLSPSAITTVSSPAFTTPDPSIALDSAPVYNNAAVLALAIRIYVSRQIPCHSPCTREGFEFEFLPIGWGN